MVGLVLGVVIFDEQARTLEAVIMRPAGFLRTGPGKIKMLPAVFLQLIQSVIGNIPGQTKGKLVDKVQQLLLLGERQGDKAQADRVSGRTRGRFWVRMSAGASERKSARPRWS